MANQNQQQKRGREGNWNTSDQNRMDNRELDQGRNRNASRDDTGMNRGDLDQNADEDITASMDEDEEKS